MLCKERSSFHKKKTVCRYGQNLSRDKNVMTLTNIFFTSLLKMLNMTLTNIFFTSLLKMLNTRKDVGYVTLTVCHTPSQL